MLQVMHTVQETNCKTEKGEIRYYLDKKDGEREKREENSHVTNEIY